MTTLPGNNKRWLVGIVAGLLVLAIAAFGIMLVPRPGNGVNVILMIGDGMGWEMARAASVANGKPFYTNGKGSGLSFQNLSGYTFATTYGTTIKGKDGKFTTGSSALDDSNPETGASKPIAGFSFNPLPFNPGNDGNGGSTEGGNLVGYDPTLGGPNPWTPGNDREYIKHSYPDSANTATTLYTGVKSYNNAIAVDIYEKALPTIREVAARERKSTGVVTSVPISHATPGAAIASVNRRKKYDADYPNRDSILQQAIGSDNKYQPTVLLGGGHPLDFDNKTNVGPKYDYEYIKQSTYEELKAKPANNRYGYTFLERGPNAAKVLMETAVTIDPNKGSRLFGLYGARGQNGNLPVSTANGDYSNTGLDNFSVYTTAVKNKQVPKFDTVRPLSPGETDAQFIAREKNENPTLADLTKAALTVLGKDPDGFWLMVEGGDIDWACHDNNIDNSIGAVNDFDKAVQAAIAWIEQNGGWSKNLLIVTADHDHYLNLNPDFPQLLAKNGAEALTYQKHDPKEAGHFWGSDPNVKYGWGNHSNRPVPVYFQGETSAIAEYIGKGYKAYGFDIPGVPDAIDQTHIYQSMFRAVTAPTNKQKA